MLLISDHALLKSMNASSPLGASALTLLDALDQLLNTRPPAIQAIFRTILVQWNSQEVTSTEAANMLDALERISIQKTKI